MLAYGPSYRARFADIQDNADHRSTGATSFFLGVLGGREGLPGYYGSRTFPRQVRSSIRQLGYKRPSTDADRVKQVHAGHRVIVTGATRDFVEVHLSDGSTGYVPLGVVELFRPSDKILTLSSNTGVYAGPHLGNAKLATVHRGQNVHVIGVELSYLKIKTADGVEGFIPVSTVQ